MALFPFNPNAGQTIQGQTISVTPIDMSFLAHYRSKPVVAAPATVLAVTTLNAAAQPGLLPLIQPDVPRAVSITGGFAGQNGHVIVYGTDVSGAAITDDITSNGAALVDGTKAFKTITKIDLPARNAVGDTISVGVNNKLGMAHKLFNAAVLLVKLFNGAADGGAFTADATDLCKNVFALAGVGDGAKYVDLFYIV